ncbi:2,4-dienoyl-CoA reductase [Nannocystis exedens]|uniref:2,4-dienoyl-CoA reductase n=1 Tax=Nannocystis exedens TaxID=54 RepID=A0A1I2HSM1_9BACT|nr:NADH:flavin oxidoreductase [Nannocystis exedens]PCC69372.1 oxidoreductase [Nannocystis exedens]SFF31381.1 2,4-dienoyl-CoA reductase [Nannocystis exedens]
MSGALLSPIRLRNGLVARNRVWLAPLTNQQSNHDGVLSPEEQRWLERRAAGGFGVIETCAAHVSEDGQGFDGQLGVWGDHQLPRLRELAARIGQAGALGLVQLYHGGVRSPSRLTGRQPWSASSFTEARPDFEVPRAAEVRDIEAAIDAFEQAARRTAAAGFHGVELHGAHGYLLGQFLSRVMNQRTDEWGGSFANRARLIRTIARRVRAATPQDFLVGARISPEDFGHARGLDLDESLQLAAWLAEDGVDFLHVSLWDTRKNTAKRPDQHAVPLFRAALPKDVQLVVAGNIWTRAEAEAELERGADFVALGKVAILNPDWPRHAADPSYQPERGPLTPAQLHDLAISDRFVDYLRRFKTIVRDA